MAAEAGIEPVNSALGTLGWTRTSDLLVRNQVLSPLSYEGVGRCVERRVADRIRTDAIQAHNLAL